jgi:hypothetical protein
MLNITIYKVMEQQISNKEVIKIMKSYLMKQTMELRCVPKDGSQKDQPYGF